MKNIRKFCKDFQLKFEKKTDFGFISSMLVDVNAGMERNLITGEIVNAKIRKIGSRRIYFDMHVFSDGDISFGKQYKNQHVIVGKNYLN